MPSTGRTQTTHRTTSLVRGELIVPGLVVLSLYLIGSFFPGQRFWGIDEWSVLPLWGRIVIILTYCLFCLQPLVTLIAKLSSQTNGRSASTRIVNGISGRILISTALFLVFYVFRSEALLYGDGYLVLDRSTLSLSAPLSDIHEYSKPLTIYLYRLSHSMLSGVFGSSANQAFAATSAVLGILGFFGLKRLVNTLSADAGTRTALLWSCLGCTCIVMFFGHVEQYAPGLVALIWWSSELVLFHRGVNRFEALALSTLLMLACNILLTPALIILTVRRQSAAHAIQKSNPGSPLAITLALSFLGSIAIAWLFQHFAPGVAIVPLYPTVDSTYWSLSTEHLSDMVNLLLYVSPLGVILVLIGAWRRGWPQGDGRILLATSALLINTSFWLDPVLGAARDWDLLASFGFLVTVGGCLIWINSLKDNGHIKYWAIHTFAIAILLIVPQVIEKSSESLAVRRLNNIVVDSPHYQPTYKQGRNLLQWGTILSNSLGRGDLAMEYFQRRLQAVPEDPLALYNVGVLQYNLQQFDSAVRSFAQAYRIEPQQRLYRDRLANALDMAGRVAEAREMVGNDSSSVWANASNHRRAALSLAERGKNLEALSQFRLAYSSSDRTPEDAVNIAIAHQLVGNLDSAIYYFVSALSVVDSTTWCEVQASIAFTQLRRGKNSDAANELEHLKKRCPGSPSVPVLDSLIRLEDLALP